MNGHAKLNGAQSAYLDLLRALAAMSVLFGHASELFLENGPLARSNIQTGGVMVFFLLSGFLISYSVFQKHREMRYGFREYFIDRFARIYCAFIPALLLVWFIDSQSAMLPLQIAPDRLETLSWIYDFKDNMAVQTWIGNLFMLQDFPLFQVLRRIGIPQNPWFFKEFGTAAPFWTISIEWWIYMLFGMLAIIGVKQGRKFRPWQLLVLAIVAIEPFYYMIGGFDNCLTLLWIAGMTAAFVFLNLPARLQARGVDMDGRKWRRGCLMAAAGAVICMGGRLVALKMNTGEMKFPEFHFGAFLALAVFAGLFALSGVKQVPKLLATPVRFVADYSFSLYLTHATVLSYIYIRFPGRDDDMRTYWTGIIACNLVAIVFWWLFERHYRQLARWLKTRLGRKDNAGGVA